MTTTTILFHEIGEAVVGKATKRARVVKYENEVRKILKMQPRPTDLEHSDLDIKRIIY